MNPIPGYQGNAMKAIQASRGLPEEKYNKTLNIIPGYRGFLGAKHQQHVDKQPINKVYDHSVRNM